MIEPSVLAGADGDGRLPRWLHRARRRRVGRARTAFVLAGGGNRGAVQVGMLDALVERGVTADFVLGVSVGAINATAFAGDPTVEGLQRMAAAWSGIDRDGIFPHGRLHGRWQFLQRRDAVYPNDGIRSIVGESVLYEHLEDASIPVELVATSLSDGHEHWFTSGPVVEAVLASSALPGIFPPVQIGDHAYIDGGVVDDVPISRAIARGATRVYVLLCNPLDHVAPVVKRPVDAIVAAFTMSIRARFNRERAALPPDVEMIPLWVEDAPSVDFWDFSRSRELIQLGRASALSILDEVAAEAADATTAGRAPSLWSRHVGWAQRGAGKPAALLDGVPDARPVPVPVMGQAVQATPTLPPSAGPLARAGSLVRSARIRRSGSTDAFN